PFLQGAAATAGALALGGLGRVRGGLAQTAVLPPPALSGIEHVVLLMMENRSFDHFLGWLPGADGMQAGLTYLDRAGVPHSTHRLAPDYQGCGHPDPDHSYEGGRIEYDNGAADGWLRAGANDDYAIGYYTRKDLTFLGRAAPDWTACDRYFAAILAETFPNRIYQHAAQTDRIRNTMDVSTLPTIWDRLAAAGLTGRGLSAHAPPPATPLPPATPAAGNQAGLRGFRVPCVVASPLARRKQVSGTAFDHTSVLRPACAARGARRRRTGRGSRGARD